jgi:hypothetical protein
MSLTMYRRDGSAYPAGEAGIRQWAEDYEDDDKRRVLESRSWWGERVSTVWLGIDHSFFGGPPLIFETMAFEQWAQWSPPRDARGWDGRGGGVFIHASLMQERYASESDAIRGHEEVLREMRWPPSLRRWMCRGSGRWE